MQSNKARSMKYFFIEYLDLGYWPVDNCKAGIADALG